jgi:4-amino-4-deoxy-L-arabinose transferase-like glycosyltransferase
MLSFYQLFIIKTENLVIGYLFFIGLAISMLAKGPIGIVIAGLSIVPFLLIKRGFVAGLRELYTKLPIISGSILAMAIFLPWYIMAEIKTPGFINYFIIGEHLNRFLVGGWKGDLYGHAHSEPIGMIWLFFLLSTVHWSLYLIVKSTKLIRATNKYNQLIQFLKDDSNLYFFIWTIVPLLFFTFARNIIIPYSSLSLLPFSIILGSYFVKNNFWHSKIFNGLLFVPILCLVVIIINPNLIDKHSDKKLVAAFIESKKATLALYQCEPKHSTYFYSRDKVIVLRNELELSKCKDCFIVVEGLNTSEIARINNIALPNHSSVLDINEF